MRKYKLLKERRDGTRRIRALIDIIESGVKAGDLGGLIHEDSNLSHEGSCWIDKNASALDCSRVSGNARLADNARVYQQAEVDEDAWIGGNAQVYEHAQVFGDAKMLDDTKAFGSVWMYENSRMDGWAKLHGTAVLRGNAQIKDLADISRGEWTATPPSFLGCKYKVVAYSNTEIQIGSRLHTIEWWDKHGVEMATVSDTCGAMEASKERISSNELKNLKSAYDLVRSLMTFKDKEKRIDRVRYPY